MKTCPDCGCAIYEFGCVNCNEEDYITMQTEDLYYESKSIKMETNQKKEEEVKHPTLGEYRVGTSFNPGGHETVNAIKATAAKFIDLCKENKLSEARDMAGAFQKLCNTEASKPAAEGKVKNGEAMRCYAIAVAESDNAVSSIADVDSAMKKMEDAAMWAVKGATKPELPAHLES